MFVISGCDVHNNFSTTVFGPFESEKLAIAALPAAAKKLAAKASKTVTKEFEFKDVKGVGFMWGAALPDRQYYRATHGADYSLFLTIAPIENLE